MQLLGSRQTSFILVVCITILLCLVHVGSTQDDGSTRFVVEMSGSHYVELGRPIHLFCNMTAPEHDRNGKFSWFKDGRNLKDSDHVIINNYYSFYLRKLVSELQIDRSSASDTGTYICRSPTTHDLDSHRVTVLIASSSNVRRSSSSNFRRSTCAAVDWDAPSCYALLDEFYFDPVTGTCHENRGCLPGPNKFSSLEDCENTCVQH